MRWVSVIAMALAARGAELDDALARAVHYLSAEVPAWKTANGCFSCHNNGDAARALMVANAAGPLKDTLAWLRRPELWDKQQLDAAFRDKNLARIQFSQALTEAMETGLLRDQSALRRAALELVKLQAGDGSWPLDQEAALGSPATYGTPLATYASLRVLRASGVHRVAAMRAEEYLKRLKAVAVIDQAAVILALGDPGAKRGMALAALQTSDGGWGPYQGSPAEPFDTAIAVLALAPGAARARGVKWLVDAQQSNGGWPPTTRPSGSYSYAQHISTSGWATLALCKARAVK
ncbi:MAG TPA: hypothetical protein VM120_12040 [Bryobacteraceae bacterium]|nr:hypothetical protein [Bryobacteraceae bacterium]